MEGLASARTRGKRPMDRNCAEKKHNARVTALDACVGLLVMAAGSARVTSSCARCNLRACAAQGLHPRLPCWRQRGGLRRSCQGVPSFAHAPFHTHKNTHTHAPTRTRARTSALWCYQHAHELVLVAGSKVTSNCSRCAAWRRYVRQHEVISVGCPGLRDRRSRATAGASSSVLQWRRSWWRMARRAVWCSRAVT